MRGINCIQKTINSFDVCRLSTFQTIILAFVPRKQMNDDEIAHVSLYSDAAIRESRGALLEKKLDKILKATDRFYSTKKSLIFFIINMDNLLRWLILKFLDSLEAVIIMKL